MSLRLESVQAVYWSHLAPVVIPLGSGVSVFCGANGSGKSSAMDAIKAVLGARRFGQGRTPSHYIHRGPAGEADQAVVLVSASGLEPVLGEGNSLGTLCMSVSRRSRRFCLIEGSLRLEDPVADDLAAMLAAHPRERWLAPERWQREVLEPLGIDAAMIRLLELPQGEAHRVIQSRQQELVPQLLAMLGHQDRLEEIAKERSGLEEAQRQRDLARRAALAERRRVSALEEAERLHAELMARRQELAEAERALARGAQGRRLMIQEQLEALRSERAEAELALDAAHDQVSAARAALASRPQVPALAPIDGEDLHALREAAERLGADLVVDAIDPKGADRELVMRALGHRRLCLVAAEDTPGEELKQTAQDLGALVAISPEKAASKARAGGLRQLSRPRRPRVDAYMEQTGLDLIIRREEGGAWIGPEWLPLSAEQVSDGLMERLDAADQNRSAATVLVAQLDRRRRELEMEALEIGPAEEGEGEGPESQLSLEELRAERAACMRTLSFLEERIRVQGISTDQLAERASSYAQASARLEDAERVLGEHDETVERMLAALSEAEQLWRSELTRILDELAERFAELSEATGMEGKLIVESDPINGVRIDLLVRERPGRPLKGFFRDGDLSGGWRAKTGLLLILAALTGENSHCPLVMVDEHAASLDEDRSQELGEVFRGLADREGLQFLLCAPTKRSSEGMNWCDSQIGFLAPEGEAEWAPPPLVISSSPAATRIVAAA